MKAGKLKLIAVCTPKRLAQFPEIPTVSESGLSGYEFNSWFALMAPAGTPRPVIQRLQQETVKAMSDASVREQLMAMGLTPRGTTPDELATALHQQLARYEALFRQAGIRAD